MPLADINRWLAEHQALLTALFGFVALIYYIFRVTLAVKLERGRATIELVKFLQSDKVRDARREVVAVANNTKAPPDHFRDSVGTVASTYSVAGDFIRSKLVHGDIIFSGWGPTFRKTEKVMDPIIASFRLEAGDQYLNGYEAFRSLLAEYEKEAAFRRRLGS
jgi:hypothetical protein